MALGLSSGHRIPGDRTTRVRGSGWEWCHVAIDDQSRLAYLEVLPDETGESCTAFWERAQRFYERHGMTVQRALTDNGSGYRSTVFTPSPTTRQRIARPSCGRGSAVSRHHN